MLKKIKKYLNDDKFLAKGKELLTEMDFMVFIILFTCFGATLIESKHMWNLIIILFIGVLYLVFKAYLKHMYWVKVVNNGRFIANKVKDKKITNVTTEARCFDINTYDTLYQKIIITYLSEITGQDEQIEFLGLLKTDESYSHDNHWHIGFNGVIKIYKPISYRYIDAWDKW